ncbi:MAG: hypothetical protein KF803_12555 [Cyclobacteriaceae bacterium]|nr:hypothetical protein [Cyclobacteriaceae bacterium]
MIKVVSRLASLLIVAGALVFFSNCGGDDPKDPVQKTQLSKLSKTWTIVSAQLGSTIRTPEFQTPNFTLTISGAFNSNNPNGPYNYSVGGTRPTPSPWPASGQWSFAVTGTGDTGSLQRSDGLTMAYTISSSGQLTLTFECEDCDYAGSRTEEVNGVWTFVLQ